MTVGPARHTGAPESVCDNDVAVTDPRELAPVTVSEDAELSPETDMLDAIKAPCICKSPFEDNVITCSVCCVVEL